MQQNHCQDSATYSDGSKTQAHAPTVRALKTARCEGACRAPGGGGNPFINSLPFNAILQQDIESRFARNRRARQIHSQTFVCERQRDDVWHHAHPQASPLPTPKAVSAVGARSSTQPSAAKSPRASTSGRKSGARDGPSLQHPPTDRLTYRRPAPRRLGLACSFVQIVQ
jgi:hypothetical protein